LAPPGDDERRRALEQAIHDEPDDEARYLVLADHLQLVGDPRGELIVAQHAGRLADGDGLLRRHADALLGRLRLEPTDGVSIEWRCGYIRRLKLAALYRTEVRRHLRALLDSPSSRFVVELVLDLTSVDRAITHDILGWIVRAALPLRRVEIHAMVGLELGRFLRAAPRLRALNVASGWSPVGVGGLHQPELEELRIPAEVDALAKLASGRCPRLWRLRLELGPGVRAVHLAPVLDGHLEHLVDLALDAAPLTAPWIPSVVATSRALPRLRRLELGSVDDETARFLLEAAESFAGLGELVLRVTRGVSRELRARLATLCSRVVIEP
jgi:uncharacterized protein (TIGR02996 family)